MGKKYLTFEGPSFYSSSIVFGTNLKGIRRTTVSHGQTFVSPLSKPELMEWVEGRRAHWPHPSIHKVVSLFHSCMVFPGSAFLWTGGPKLFTARHPPLKSPFHVNQTSTPILYKCWQMFDISLNFLNQKRLNRQSLSQFQ